MIILKQMYVHDGRKFEALTIRNYTETDIERLISLQKECFPPPFPRNCCGQRTSLTAISKPFRKALYARSSMAELSVP